MSWIDRLIDGLLNLFFGDGTMLILGVFWVISIVYLVKSKEKRVKIGCAVFAICAGLILAAFLWLVFAFGSQRPTGR